MVGIDMTDLSDIEIMLIGFSGAGLLCALVYIVMQVIFGGAR